MDSKLFFNINYGLYVVSSKFGNKYNAQIANTVFQITSKPPILAVSIANINLTHKYILSSKVFSITIISNKWTMKDIGIFGFRSGREIDKFKSINYEICENKCPVILDKTIGYFECTLVKTVDFNTHSVFFGDVKNAVKLSDDTPMTYNFYREILKGKSPKNAPTHL